MVRMGGEDKQVCCALQVTLLSSPTLGTLEMLSCGSGARSGQYMRMKYVIWEKRPVLKKVLVCLNTYLK